MSGMNAIARAVARESTRFRYNTIAIVSASAVAPVVWPLGKETSALPSLLAGANCCGNVAVKSVPAVIATNGAEAIGSHTRVPRPRKTNAVATQQMMRRGGDVKGVTTADKSSSKRDRDLNILRRTRSSVARAVPLATAFTVIAKRATLAMPAATATVVPDFARDIHAYRAISVPH